MKERSTLMYWDYNSATWIEEQSRKYNVNFQLKASLSVFSVFLSFPTQRTQSL
jgi:hypothetical protein